MCCTVLYCTVLCYNVLYCNVQYCTVLYCDALCCTVMYCTVLYCTVLYYAVLCCTVQYCAVMWCAVLCCTVLYYAVTYVVEALHGSHVFCLSSHVRWRCAGAQRENTKRILLLFSYGNIICRHLQKKILDYITWWIYILSHFGSILLCHSNPDADR